MTRLTKEQRSLLSAMRRMGRGMDKRLVDQEAKSSSQDTDVEALQENLGTLAAAVTNLQTAIEELQDLLPP